jgi:hypothetical protein
MTALGHRHAELEGTGELEPLMATLVPEPYYEFHPIGLCMRGGDVVRRYYEQFFEHFAPLQHDGRMLGEWVNETAMVQEYELTLNIDGALEIHNVVGVLFADAEAGLLGGERVYASEAFLRRMTGSIFDELEPIAR